MRNARKLKVKIKCNCNDHYLELLKTFDGYTYTYRKCCTKCGRWWTDTCSKYVHSYNNTNGHLILTFMTDNVHGYHDTYALCPDGTLDHVVKRVYF